MMEQKKQKKRAETVLNRTMITDMTEIALMTALFCVLAPLTVYLPFTPIGITFCSFLVYLAGGILGCKKAFLSILLYLALGFFGLPVFSGYSSGAGKLFGPTGGYLIGYLFCAFLIGLLAKQSKNKVTEVGLFLLATVFGSVVLYLFGSVWFFFVYSGKLSFLDVLKKCVIPFFPLDACKIAICASLLLPLRRALRSLHN